MVHYETTILREELGRIEKLGFGQYKNWSVEQIREAEQSKRQLEESQKRKRQEESAINTKLAGIGLNIEDFEEVVSPEEADPYYLAEWYLRLESKRQRKEGEK